MRLYVLALITAVAVSACDAPQASETSTNDSRPKLAVADPVAPAGRSSGDSAAPKNPEYPECADSNPNYDIEECGEPDASVSAYTGVWRVTGVKVAESGAQAFVENDAQIVGSVFSVNRKKIYWQSKASEAFSADDVCETPSAYPAVESVIKENGDSLTQALAQLDNTARKTAQVLRFGCIKSGKWGPGDEGGGNSLFAMTGKNQMMLQWYDGATLVAER